MSPTDVYNQTGSASGKGGLAPGEALTNLDQEILTNVEESLHKGIQLMRWWQEADKTKDFQHLFELTRVLNRPETGYSFFSDAKLPNETVRVIGDSPNMYFDQPKDTGGLLAWREQVREFALRYFMRISAFELPEPVLEGNSGPKHVPFDFLSLFPKDDPAKMGFGFEQLYYKPRGGGPARKISGKNRYAIIDVRDLLDKYEWVVANVNTFNFNVRVPADPYKSGLQIPLNGESVKVILHRDFVTINEHPDEPSGTFSFGYATLKSPTKSFLAYGPGAFDVGFQAFYFHVHKNGEIRVRMPFCVNRPEKLANIPINPLEWGFMAADLLTFGKAKPLLGALHKIADSLPFADASISPVLPTIRFLNLVTGGLAAKDYNISREGLEKILLAKHFDQYYTMLTGTLLTWRQVDNWANPKCIPQWVAEGHDVHTAAASA